MPTGERISGRNRRVFADNFPLSKARAQVVADYLAAALNIPVTRVHVEGHGRAASAGKDAASLAANRRVDAGHRRRAFRSERAARAQDRG